MKRRLFRNGDLTDEGLCVAGLLAIGLILLAIGAA